MYYTGIDPLTMKNVYVATDYHEKQLQRALLQFNRPQNADLVREALIKAGRQDLIGYGPDCLVRPENGRLPQTKPLNDHTRKAPNGKKNNKNHGGKAVYGSPKTKTSRSKKK
jgi:hypothetical protein